MTDLGPRASLLLGMLGGPQTAAEIRRSVAAALDDPATLAAITDTMPEDALVDALCGIDEGGVPEVERLLDRLRELGLTDYVELEGVRLWSRRRVAA